jgi:outer membrane biosynthesis protein TonB
VIWEPFVLALVLGLIVSAGLYYAYLWPSVEPIDPEESIAAKPETKPAVEEPKVEAKPEPEPETKPEPEAKADEAKPAIEEPASESPSA